MLVYLKKKIKYSKTLNIGTSSGVANGTLNEDLKVYNEYDRLSKLTATCVGQHGVTACVCVLVGVVGTFP